MKTIFPFRTVLLLLALTAGFSAISCSRKSGCPAEDVHTKMDKDGNFKAGKTSSGLLPPKASKKRRKG